MVILDTSVIIDHLRQPFNKSALVKIIRSHPKESLCISIISIQELYEGQSTRDEEEEEDLIAVIAPLKILPYSYDIAKCAGQIMRDISTPLEFMDAAIAATAILHGAQLFTLNKKDFERIGDLELYK
ncbi:hypothetical protein A2960_05870 [Candidatus Gottesmanbacteria bacterium RIFCSPLOWO2_01_FULL_39_12b]|uniref:Ribonuclease VapC n=1 Tax=Candidatus Gottesmanbacteria bacterium RIFCSPLOWO2_01_FULL_39_12b TaxID=1798388 RepID=A0A1F6ANG1_9BACT|nr:MAG: hypothetical protein A2960_05870 [Candidatus Gottesmanbacteria bacterium RIFCSPLOWO2_01_FULL_39_12b]